MPRLLLSCVRSPWLQGSLPARFPIKESSRSSSIAKFLGQDSHKLMLGRRFFHRIAGLSTRDMADLEEHISSVVGKNVLDPEIGRTLNELGWINRRLAVSKDGTIQLLLKLPTLLHPSLEELKDTVTRTTESEVRSWIKSKELPEIELKVNVEAIATTPLPAEDPKELESRLGPGLVNVANYLAVYSCKGGVGKSTIAVNLAYEMARLGGRVGLLDLDVYGPSLPVLVKPADVAVRRSPLGKGMVYPIEHEGVKLLSLGFVSSKSGVPGSGPDGGAAVLRGPMAGKVVTQLLKGTDWGDLDVLILDLPPGTGDVQLTLCQDIELSGAVGVTTPSKLAVADARKGIQMFSELGVATLAMVENMAFFDCEGGTRHYPFGKGIQEFMNGMDEIRPGNICQLPISSYANDATEDGLPLTLARPAKAETELAAMSHLARIVSSELLKLPFRPESSVGVAVFDDATEKFGLSSIQLSLENGTFLLRAFSEEGAIQRRISPHDLRSRDPKTGVVIDDDEDNKVGPASEKGRGMVEIHRAGATKGAGERNSPERLEKKGKVGFEVTWGDGAKYIYSRRAVTMAGGGKVTKS